MECFSLHNSDESSPTPSPPPPSPPPQTTQWVHCRPAYQKLLSVLQEQGMPSAQFHLTAPHLTTTTPPPPHHHSTGSHQQPYSPHGHQPQHSQSHQQHQHAAVGGGAQREVQRGSAAALPSSTAPIVKVEEQVGLPRQQVYAHELPFHTIASLQPVSSLLVQTTLGSACLT